VTTYVGSFTGRQILLAMRDSGRPSRMTVVVLRLSPLWLFLLVVGGYAGVLGWRPGALAMLAAVCCRVTGHLLVGLTEYRRTMREPWPKVSPLDHDDDW
jgi:hypothetical protein